MSEKSVVQMNLLERYLLRKGFRRRVQTHLRRYARKLLKDAFADQKKILPPNKANVIFDLGANEGAITQIYRRLYPAARIYCFEPFPGNYSKLAASFSGDSHIQCYEMAISDRTGNMCLQVSQGSESHSLYEPSSDYIERFPQAKTVARIEVETITLHDFCQQHGIEKIDILKMDVEGAELAVLRGAATLLNRGAISLIYTEFFVIPNFPGHPLLHDIAQYLYDFGYSIFNIYTKDFRNHQLRIGDAIFISNEVYESLRESWE